MQTSLGLRCIASIRLAFTRIPRRRGTKILTLSLNVGDCDIAVQGHIYAHHALWNKPCSELAAFQTTYTIARAGVALPSAAIAISDVPLDSRKQCLVRLGGEGQEGAFVLCMDGSYLLQVFASSQTSVAFTELDQQGAFDVTWTDAQGSWSHDRHFPQMGAPTTRMVAAASPVLSAADSTSSDSCCSPPPVASRKSDVSAPAPAPAPAPARRRPAPIQVREQQQQYHQTHHQVPLSFTTDFDSGDVSMNPTTTTTTTLPTGILSSSVALNVLSAPLSPTLLQPTPLRPPTLSRGFSGVPLLPNCHELQLFGEGQFWPCISDIPELSLPEIKRPPLCVPDATESPLSSDCCLGDDFTASGSGTPLSTSLDAADLSLSCSSLDQQSSGSWSSAPLSSLIVPLPASVSVQPSAFLPGPVPPCGSLFVDMSSSSKSGFGLSGSFGLVSPAVSSFDFSTVGLSRSGSGSAPSSSPALLKFESLDSGATWGSCEEDPQVL